MTVWKIYRSTFTRFISNKLGRLLTLRRIFSMQMLKSSPTSCMIICKIFFQLMVTVYMGSNIRSRKKGRKVSQMHYLVIWANLSNFPWSWWETHLRINPKQSLGLWKDLSLRLMVKKFQRLSRVQFPSSWPWPGVLISYLKSKQETKFEKHPLHTLSLGLGILFKAGLPFLKYV